MNGKQVGKNEAKDEEEEGKVNTTSTTEVLTVCEFVPKADRSGLQQPKCGTNLYVKNFPDADFSDDELRKRFEVYGEIVSAVVMRDEATGKSKEFGFVCFQNWQDAQKALDELKGSGSSGNASSDEKEAAKATAADNKAAGLYVREAKTKEQRTMELQKSTYQFKKSMQLLNLVVKNVDPSATKQEFEEFFANFGTVNNSKLNTDSQIGFVSF